MITTVVNLFLPPFKQPKEVDSKHGEPLVMYVLTVTVDDKLQPCKCFFSCVCVTVERIIFKKSIVLYDRTNIRLASYTLIKSIEIRV